MNDDKTSYLKSLKFDPKLWDRWYAKYIVQIRLVLMLIFSIIALGLFGYYNLPKRLNPEVKIPIVVVSTILPGSSPEDIESLVTIPLENRIKSIQGIDTLVSTSLDNSSVISVQFLSTVDADQAKADVQAAVDSVADLPADALTPNVNKVDFENQPVWTFAITSNQDFPSLMRFSSELQDRLEDLPKVDRVQTSGLDAQEVEVIIKSEKLIEYNINPVTLSQVIQKATNSHPAGNTRTDKFTFALSIEKNITTLDDVRNLKLNIEGKPILLSDIADISLISTPYQRISLFGKRNEDKKYAVTFFVFKTGSANIDEAETEARQEAENFIKGKQGLELVTISNSAELITEQFNDLTREFSTTIILVFALLLLFLGLRQAVISSLTVPLTFLSSFVVIYAMGLSFNFLTMFSFLIALGVLIDDAIVVVAAMTRYYATNKFTPAETGVLVWRDFIVPLVSTSVTTIWAFVPLLLATGIIGEFIKTIPIVVTVTMVASTLIALLITLPLMVVFLKPEFPKRVNILLKVLLFLTLILTVLTLSPKNVLTPLIFLSFIIFLYITNRNWLTIKQYMITTLSKNKYLKNLPKTVQKIMDQGYLDIEVLSRAYMRIINRVLMSKHGKRNTMIAITAFTVLAYLLVPLGLVKNEFFPKEDAELLYISVELPSGTNINQTNIEAENLLNQTKELDEVNFVVVESGQGFSGFGDRSSSNNNILATLHLTPLDERAIPSWEIAQNIRQKFQDYSKGTLTVQEISGGPPAGADVQITILGDDLTALDQYANSVVKFLESEAGITNVNKSIKPGTSKIVFIPDQDKLIQHNLSVDAISLYLRTYATNFNLDKFTFEKDEQEINLYIKNDPTPEGLGAISIPTQTGPMPLLSLGKLVLSPNPTVITREEGKRSITITASVVAGNNIAEKNQALANFATNELNLAPGYSWKTGGVNEENERSVQSILQAMLVSFILILVTMVIEFRSFRQTFIALMFIPISISGVFYIFALSGTPLSFPALIGVLALFGIVVRHAIVVIEKINDNLHEEMPLREAVVDAAGNRLEPVLLTSLAAILGLIPITLSDPLWRGLGGAIIAGLLFSGAIKLFFVPVAYYLMFPEKRKK